MIPKVERGGDFSDFSILERYPFVKPVWLASCSRVNFLLIREALILLPISDSMNSGFCFVIVYTTNRHN